MRHLLPPFSSGVPERRDSVLDSINVKTRQWSEWGPLDCFLKQAELKDDLDRLQRRLDGAILNFSVRITTAARVSEEVAKSWLIGAAEIGCHEPGAATDHVQVRSNSPRYKGRVSCRPPSDPRRPAGAQETVSDLITTARGGGYDAPPDCMSTRPTMPSGLT